MCAGQVCVDGGGGCGQVRFVRMEECDVGRSGLCGWRRVMWAGQVCVDGGG